MHVLICRHWTATLREPLDWGEQPLGAYVLTDDFLASIADRTQRSLRQAAWVCAMLACGRVQALQGLGVRQRSGNRAGGQLVCAGTSLMRADGAKGWECPLGSSYGELRLRYWIHPDGTVELDALVGAGKHTTCSRERFRRQPIQRRP